MLAAIRNGVTHGVVQPYGGALGVGRWCAGLQVALRIPDLHADLPNSIPDTRAFALALRRVPPWLAALQRADRSICRRLLWMAGGRGQHLARL